MSISAWNFSPRSRWWLPALTFLPFSRADINFLIHGFGVWVGCYTEDSRYLLFVGLQARLITISNFLFTKLYPVVDISMKLELIYFIFILLFITNMCYICVSKCHVCIGAHGRPKRRASLETELPEVGRYWCGCWEWHFGPQESSHAQDCWGLLTVPLTEFWIPFSSALFYHYRKFHLCSVGLKETKDRLQPGIAHTIIISPTEDMG